MAGATCIVLVLNHLAYVFTNYTSSLMPGWDYLSTACYPIIFLWVGLLLRCRFNKPRLVVRYGILVATLVLLYWYGMAPQGTGWLLRSTYLDLVFTGVGYLVPLGMLEEAGRRKGWEYLLMLLVSVVCYTSISVLASRLRVGEMTPKFKDMESLVRSLSFQAEYLVLFLTLYFVLMFSFSQVGQWIGGQKWFRIPAIVAAVLSFLVALGNIVIHPTLRFGIARFIVQPVFVWLVVVLVRLIKKRKFRSLLLVAVIILSSCSRNNTVPESLRDIKEVVAQVDSMVSAMYGWEPRDSTYDTSADTLVYKLLDEYNAVNSDSFAISRADYVERQLAYDAARKTWAEFKRLCDAGKYKKALDYYLAERRGKKNEADFIVYLKHSTPRYYFFSEVLRPLLLEYKDKRDAHERYIELLKFEKAMEDVSIEMQAEGNGYVPEVYPHVVADLGFSLAAVGKMDEAKDLFSDLVSGLYWQTGDELYSYFLATSYSATVYLQENMVDEALKTWEDFRDYLKEEGNWYDPETLAECQQAVNAEILRTAVM